MSLRLRVWLLVVVGVALAWITPAEAKWWSWLDVLCLGTGLCHGLLHSRWTVVALLLGVGLIYGRPSHS